MKEVRKRKGLNRIVQTGWCNLAHCLGIIDEKGNTYSMHVDPKTLEIKLKKEKS